MPRPKRVKRLQAPERHLLLNAIMAGYECGGELDDDERLLLFAQKLLDVCKAGVDAMDYLPHLKRMRNIVAAEYRVK
jgi:hypothetical protein